MLGALKLLCNQGVHVDGIVSGARRERIEEYATSSRGKETKPNLKLFPAEESASRPHSKLIVIDGKAALYGSANLTVTGWRKLATADEQMITELDPHKVRRLHNVYFSKTWVRLLGPPSVEPFPMRGFLEDGSWSNRAWT